LDEIRRDQEMLIKKLNEAQNLAELKSVQDLAKKIGQKLTELKGDIEKGKKEEKIPDSKPKLAIVPKIDTPLILELNAQIKKARENFSALEVELKDIAEEIQKEVALDRERRQQFFQVERDLRQKQEEANTFRDRFNDSKISLAKIEVREEDLKARVTEELKMDVELLSKEPQEVADQFALEREIAKLKFQMEQIGGIDPLVLTEYDETEKRFQFLTAESQDLENALVSLREVVREMEKKVNEKFHATFDEINKEFSKYFRIIFGGGDAHLTKVNIRPRKTKEILTEMETPDATQEKEESPEDDLSDDEKNEIGIDISACPAAALDEANSKRFGRIIQDLSARTQFVTITHNRETMRQAALLYGVTMGEDGMSKLLSVRIDQVGQGGKILQA
jgi:chromosome segregation protein